MFHSVVSTKEELNGQVGEGAKLGSGPILAVLIISLLRGLGKIGPDPKTHKRRNLSRHCLVWLRYISFEKDREILLQDF